MARAVRKTLRPTGTRLPNIASTPRAKAMSVAMGIPHPGEPGPPALNAM